MKVLGFNLTKISAEKLGNNLKGVKLNTNIDVADIKDVKSDMFNNAGKVIAVKFSNTIVYDPSFAKIELAGNILLSLDAPTAESILEEWKDKKMPENFRLTLFNLILKKSTVKALQLEEELNIPLHLPMPSLKPEAKAEQK